MDEREQLDVIEVRMLRSLLQNLLNDERGGEVLEYALVAGLIVIAAISLITQIGVKVRAKWTSLNSSL